MTGDPRRCVSCSSYQPVADDPLGRHGCTNRDARTLGASPFPLADFGCRFWSPADPLACKTEVIGVAARVLYANLLYRVGRTRLPTDYTHLEFETRLVLEATALRLVQALGLIP